jgi:tetratricopeptide (TPR) repeat protein
MSDEVEYLDFEITVQKAGNEQYLLRAESASGQAEIVFNNPFNEDKRALIDATLTKVALRSSAKVRSSSAPEVKKMKEVGAVLFEQAITGPVREFFYKCQGQADQQGKGIRWRLALDPSIGDLPWEFLYLQDQFVALNPRSPVVRYIKGAARMTPLKGEHPLRILVVIASPSDVPPLDTQAEKERINAALKPLTTKGLVDVTFIEGPDTWERLMDALLPNQTHILHFIGHGAFDEKNREGVLLMEDEDGLTSKIESERFSVLVLGKSRLRLVVLNSCLGTQGDEGQPFSSMAAGLVRSGVPAVIAMQFEISDRAAREIAETFYNALALNMPVDAAITEARRKIFLSDRDSLEWATPILYMQVPNGRLFEFSGSASREGSSSSETTRPMKTAKLSPARTRTAEIAAEGSFETEAAIRYRAGEAAMAEGNWHEALRSFRGALTYVPNYRDASQKATLCESRERAAHLYREAKRLCDEKNFFKALKNLSEANRLDPSLVDAENIRDRAECGQKYGRAIGFLQNGKTAEAAELLRDVIRYQPNYEDAADRLRDLSNGGDGLLGLGRVTTSPQPSPQPFTPQPFAPQPFTPQPFAQPTPPVQPPADSGFDIRVYEVANVDCNELAIQLRHYFFREECQSQILQEGSVWLVQGQKTGFRSWLGMGLAATVRLEPQDDILKVSIGGAKWMEQGAAMVVSMILPPLLVTGGVGMAQQKQMIDTLWRLSENYVATRNGKRVQ